MGLLDWFRAGKKAGAPKAPIRKLAPADFSRLEQEMEPYRRMCLRPVTKPGDVMTLASKFCGNAWLDQKEVWPPCGYCKEPMQLLIQVVTRDLREDVRAVTGDGLLQLFYCTHDCEYSAESFEPFSKKLLARVVPHARLARGSMCARTVVKQATYPSQIITGWDEAVDYPGWGGEAPGHWDEPEWNLFQEVGSLKPGWGLPHNGDKLAGWPDWVQGLVELNCPTCKSLMIPILQIGSEDHIPYMWGDCGIGHMHVCPKHPEKAAYQWDCS